MNVVLAGIIGRYPYGGVAWCTLNYLLGLTRLGHNVWYFEDTGECNYDPVENTIASDPGYALQFIASSLAPFGLEDRWCYIDFRGDYYGKTRYAWRDICAAADLYLNLSGGCWFWRDEYAAIPHKAFIDSDPAFTQIDIAKRGPAHEAFFKPFNALFTFGRNIGTQSCSVPTSSLLWEHTWQPTCIEEWSPTSESPRECFTTVMTWKIKSFADIGGNKDREFLKVINLPTLTNAPLELAVNGPHEFLSQHGWKCRDAFAVSHSLGAYRDYIRSSLAEFSVAKRTYVETNSGWFSDRTECYLASGRPAIVQDTGFSAHLPTDRGLLAFNTVDEALAGIEEIRTAYLQHCRAARDVAVANFAPGVVLPKLLDRATAS